MRGRPARSGTTVTTLFLRFHCHLRSERVLFGLREKSTKFRFIFIEMEKINLYVAWIEILLGFFSGTVLGLFFYRDNWIDGYGSWRRRMCRLGHVSFFGIAFVNVAFVLTVKYLEIEQGLVLSSRLFIIAAFTMPLVCFVSAFKKGFRHLFFIPVTCLIAGTLILFYGGVFK